MRILSFINKKISQIHKKIGGFVTPPPQRFLKLIAQVLEYDSLQFKIAHS
ncbi:hypothetical protein [Helicobacter pylori]|nr:hypothetical protein [Helicobacter pylori]